ncbi:GntR family transcriptional regulator [Chromohalobacter sp. 48-RD10]|uniref:GntR family transcriptional regulator n=1 Tax=Chromohalobacter sp. 48-RD10 TaxID=2994063 RepID=UPI002469C52D|nr:GntR family transcriptional regulator [Chromohalobacter sp. 48-RD10]
MKVSTMRKQSATATNPLQSELDVSEPVVEVIEAIERDIIRSRILPHDRLLEDNLMYDYDAKRHVVRAALAELQRLGVVVKPPHLGAYIRRFDEQDLEDLYHMRRVLYRAAVRVMSFPIPPDRLDEVSMAMEAHARAAQTGDLVRIHRTNMTFHRLLYGLCNNPYLAESIRRHDWLSFPARAYGVADVEALDCACREHAAMVEALHDQARDRLEALSLDHMERARSIYEKKFLR